MTDTATCPLPHQHPARLDDGYQICRHHHTRLREDLTAAALVLDDLHQLLVTPAPIDGNDVRAAKTDAPAPCRLDILDLTDPRSDTPAVHVIDCWTQFVTEERNVLSSVATDTAPPSPLAHPPPRLARPTPRRQRRRHRTTRRMALAPHSRRPRPTTAPLHLPRHPPRR